MYRRLGPAAFRTSTALTGRSSGHRVDVTGEQRGSSRIGRLASDFDARSLVAQKHETRLKAGRCPGKAAGELSRKSAARYSPKTRSDTSPFFWAAAELCRKSCAPL